MVIALEAQSLSSAGIAVTMGFACLFVGSAKGKGRLKRKRQQVKKNKLPFVLKDGDYIVCAWAESCFGPGWGNSPVWVIVSDGNRKLREECIQPEFHTKEMGLLYKMSNLVSSQMTGEVKSLLKG